MFRQGRDKSQITWPELFFLLLRLRFCSASLFFSFFSSIIFHVIYHLIGGNAICERVHTHTQRPKGKLLMLFGVPYLFISIRPVLIVSWIFYPIIIIIRNVTMCLISFLYFLAFFFVFLAGIYNLLIKHIFVFFFQEKQRPALLILWLLMILRRVRFDRLIFFFFE